MCVVLNYLGLVFWVFAVKLDLFISSRIMYASLKQSIKGIQDQPHTSALMSLVLGAHIRHRLAKPHNDLDCNKPIFDNWFICWIIFSMGRVIYRAKNVCSFQTFVQIWAHEANTIFEGWLMKYILKLRGFQWHFHWKYHSHTVWLDFHCQTLFFATGLF